ncbi:MAG: hypothetical protein ACE5FF_18520 [Saprospiraceae bacterium]
MKNFDFFIVSLFTPICHTIMVGVIAIVPISTAIAQSVNNIYLNTMAKGILTFDSVQTASLENQRVQAGKIIVSK